MTRLVGWSHFGIGEMSKVPVKMSEPIQEFFVNELKALNKRVDELNTLLELETTENGYLRLELVEERNVRMTSQRELSYFRSVVDMIFQENPEIRARYSTLFDETDDEPEVEAPPVRRSLLQDFVDAVMNEEMEV